MQNKWMNFSMVAAAVVLLNVSAAGAQQIPAPAAPGPEANQPKVSPQAWKELFENKSEVTTNEEANMEAQPSPGKAGEEQNPAIKKVKEDKPPVPINNMTGRVQAQLYQQNREAREEEQKAGVPADKQTAPIVRGNARLLRMERVNRADKIKEIEEKKAQEDQGGTENSDQGK